jgi:hypothetical protein
MCAFLETQINAGNETNTLKILLYEYSVTEVSPNISVTISQGYYK